MRFKYVNNSEWMIHHLHIQGCHWGQDSQGLVCGWILRNRKRRRHWRRAGEVAASNYLTTTTETYQNSSKWSNCSTNHKKCIDLSIRPLYLKILGLETPCQTWLFHKNFDHLICYCFSCLSWVWVSDSEKQWYFGYDSGKNGAS